MGFAKPLSFFTDSSYSDSSSSGGSVFPYGNSQTETRQLKFVVEERERSEKAQFRKSSGSRPISNDDRRSQDARVLLEHFANNKKFWASMQDLPVPDSLSAVPASAESNRSDIDPAAIHVVANFLKAAVAPVGRNLRDSDRELRIVVMRGLAYLNYQLSQPVRDYAGFRTVWTLLWPILNDLSLMPRDPVTLRVAMQKILAKSF